MWNVKKIINKQTNWTKYRALFPPQKQTYILPRQRDCFWLIGATAPQASTEQKRWMFGTRTISAEMLQWRWWEENTAGDQRKELFTLPGDCLWSSKVKFSSRNWRRNYETSVRGGKKGIQAREQHRPKPRGMEPPEKPLLRRNRAGPGFVTGQGGLVEGEENSLENCERELEIIPGPE